MGDAESQNGSLTGSLYSWGASWVEYAQQQITSILGTEELEVVDPDAEGAQKGGELVNANDQRQKLWSNFQQYIGHDITSLISVPVWIMEPLTVLQRMGEIMEYTELLDQANQCDDEYKRLALLLAFAVTPYGCIERPWKPFNPILGETFELECGDGVRFLAEQVSHHPPIGAAHAENANFEYDIVSAPKSKFLGNSAEIYPLGRSRVHLKATGETFYVHPPTSKACNVVVGRTWIDNYGLLSMTNAANGNKAEVEFTPCGWFGQGRYEFSGYVYEASTGKRKMRITGMWNSHCDCVPVDDQGGEDVEPDEVGPVERLWTCKDKPEGEYYGRTYFALRLGACSGIPEPLQSDSRRRPDRSALDEEDSAAAGSWKYRLEEMQRAEQRWRERNGDAWKPQWFEEVKAGDPRAPLYDGEYDFDAVPGWVWAGKFGSDGSKPMVKEGEGSILGRGFSPWQYPELHKAE